MTDASKKRGVVHLHGEEKRHRKKPELCRKDEDEQDEDEETAFYCVVA